MAETVKQNNPHTAAEVRALRAAYADGFLKARRSLQHRASALDTAIAEQEARLAIPMPTETVPNVIGVSFGGEYRIVGGRVEYRGSPYITWSPTSFTPDDFTKLGELAAKPTIEREVTE